MKKISKTPCKLTLEEEYAFEHNQRIKAENHIKEVWEYNTELEKEVNKLQSIINKGEHLPKEKPPLNDDKALEIKLKKIYKDREVAIKKYERRLKCK
tara:strand:+ start:132 stop:422 length:291 start_codon:yes stop_codon:yes gene_type:complete